MEKRKLSFIFIILIALCASNLFAEEEDEEEKSNFVYACADVFEKLHILPWPIISLESGYPEVFSFDLGLETLFIPVADEGCLGTYFCFGYARSLKDNFFRFSAGIALGMMGLIDMHGGCGYGLMPKNHDVLHTFFTEASFRLIIFEFKCIYEKPLKPSNLVDYYKNTYTAKDGYKFKIGLSL